MGTNFYLARHLLVDEQYVADEPCECCGRRDAMDHMDPQWHIGKRSAAGLYCWDCDRTLCVDGVSKIHHDSEWYEACPQCGKRQEAEKDSITEGAGAVELGFSPPRTARPTGVRSCASFSWAQPSELFVPFARDHGAIEVVRDEYGCSLTGDAFLTMLQTNCPVQFIRCVGQYFG